jgi:DNA-binding transcriptional LysR family regulator
MRITFSQVRGFVTVASTGSFTRAADVLHLSQPALTTRIRQLEEALDLRLLNRNTRSLELTEAGKELLPIFRRLVGDLEGAVNNARQHSRKSNAIIRLACLPSFAATLLPDLISKFQAKRPEATFVVQDVVNSQIRALVREGHVDFGICVYEGEEPDLVFEELFEDDLMVIYRPGHPLHSAKRITMAELVQHRLILISRGSSIREAVEKAFAAGGLSVSPACEVTYMSTAVALVQAGMGIAILPSTAIEARSAGILARRIDDSGFVRKLVLVKRKSAALSKVVQQFVESVVTTLAATKPRQRR